MMQTLVETDPISEDVSGAPGPDVDDRDRRRGPATALGELQTATTVEAVERALDELHDRYGDG